jgi:threonine synthase
MQLYSTNNPQLHVPFQEAVFNSFPQDKGLYMPVHIPRLDTEWIKHITNYTLPEIAFHVAKNLLQDAIPHPDLKKIIEEAINFDAPIVELDTNTFVLELFHGPSLAFKDFGARFMSRVMSYFLRDNDKQELHVLVATSGDTGGAVALGFLNVPGTHVTILFPKGKVSPIQEMQLTAHGQNVHAIEIDGTFDDCQTLVKQAFADAELNNKFRLTSANSINIARLIPQMFYYFYAYAQAQKDNKQEVVFSVPSGNFGNLAAGILAWRMGLPVKQFLAATNSNDTVPIFLHTGIYQPKVSVQTYSNAMDVGNPSNWARILNLFDQDVDALKKMIIGYSFSDNETIQAIKRVYQEHHYIVCPHTAIAWLALKKWQSNHPEPAIGIFLSTAHPCKFPEVFPEAIAAQIETPQQVETLKRRKSETVSLSKSFIDFKAYLMKEIN